MRAYYSDTFVLPLPETHRFPMAKYRLLRERLLAEGVLAADDLHLPEAIGWDALRLAHDPEYVHAIATGTLPAEKQRRIGFPWSADMVERSRRSVGATLAAARAARVEAVAANLAGGTHHAFSGQGGGYCVFNDVAVAARVLLREGGLRRVAIVDCDVHQGDGTAAIFAADRRSVCRRPPGAAAAEHRGAARARPPGVRRLRRTQDSRRGHDGGGLCQRRAGHRDDPRQHDQGGGAECQSSTQGRKRRRSA